MTRVVLTGVTIDIPTAVTSEEVAVLRTLARGKRVLEVGSLLGASTVAVAQVAKYVVSIDPHEGYPADNPRPTLVPFLENLERYYVRNKVRVCVGTHDQFFPLFEDESFDLVFIDTTGEYDLTRTILEESRRLVEWDGALAVHDCGHPDWPGALDAVKTFTEERDLDFTLTDRLAVIYP